MTVLDSSIALARALPADRRAAVEDALAALMDSYVDRFEPEEIAEPRRRAGETHRAFSDPDDIARLFGKPFRSCEMSPTPSAPSVEGLSFLPAVPHGCRSKGGASTGSARTG